MFAARTIADKESNDVNEMQYSLDDLHSEFHLKFSSPNRGLKQTERLAPKPQQPPSKWQIIYKEFQDRIQAHPGLNARN